MILVQVNVNSDVWFQVQCHSLPIAVHTQPQVHLQHACIGWMSGGRSMIATVGGNWHRSYCDAIVRTHIAMSMYDGL